MRERREAGHFATFELGPERAVGPGMSRTAPRTGSRRLVAMASLTIVTVATLASGAARAEASGAKATDASSTSEGASERASLPKYAVIGRAGFDSGRFGFGATYAADVMVRAREGLFFGGGFEIGTRVTGLEGCSTLANGCDVARQRVGARAELHAAPRSWIDPWVGAYLGLVHVSYVEGGATAGINAPSISSYGVEARAEAGLDVRIALGDTELRFGPAIAAGAAHGDGGRLFAGLRAGLAF
jgi:hypothetical protein